MEGPTIELSNDGETVTVTMRWQDRAWGKSLSPEQARELANELLAHADDCEVDP